MTRFHDLLRAGAEAHGERPGVLFEDGVLSHAALLARAEGIAAGFRQLGIAETDHVATLMDNSLECVLAWLASSIVGCTEVPLNPQYRGDLLRYLLHDSQATAVICDGAYLANVLELAPALPSLRLVIVNGELPPVPGKPHCVMLKDCELAETCAPAADPAERVILYTSGTTGPSKGVVHTQASCLTLSRYNAEVMEYGADDRLLNFFPLYHQNARYTGVVPALLAGARIRIERRLSTSGFWRTCDADGVTAFNYLGSVLRLIMNVTPDDRVAGTHALRKAFGAGAPPAEWEAFEERLGVRLVETYGLSEAPMATLNTRRGALKSAIGSAGRSSALFEVAVVNEHDAVAPAGQVGEIVMRPRRPDALMIGYHGKNEATVEAFRNLWFHSGDRGRMTQDGELYFEDRLSDSIRRRGENISAWEIESVFEQHPDIAEVAIYGVGSADADEDVAAAIVTKGPDTDLAQILDFARERLPGYAVPSLIALLPDLPKTPTAKVQKSKLRALDRAAYLTPSDIQDAS